MNRRREIDPAAIEHLYADQGLTIEQVAAYLRCSATTIRRRLGELDIRVRPRGPHLGSTTRSSCYEWSPALAYAVGVITTDGNLSKDGRHMTLVSAERDLLKTFCRCLALDNRITQHHGSQSLNYRVQWSNRAFYDWLLDIGLMPAKTLRLGALKIPDEYFADFVRGCLDGDGNIQVYTDRYNIFKNAKYVYERLNVRLVSASLSFLEWLQSVVERLLGVHGGIFESKPRAGHAPLWTLKYSKRDSIRLLRWLYYAEDIPCLKRKRKKAVPFLAESDTSTPKNRI